MRYPCQKEKHLKLMKNDIAFNDLTAATEVSTITYFLAVPQVGY